jgi:probable H4MPT-linked C1 transfer pathway protein
VKAYATTIVGLDIGGANLKAATPSGEAITFPFELWRQPGRLPEALTRLLERWPGYEQVAVTMTGEFCDCFETKRIGVESILSAVEQVCAGKEVYVWGTDGEWRSTSDARQDPLTVAAANWHALATYAARFAGSGSSLLIDTGSTTTDIVPIRAGIPATIGRTDPDRLRSGELVYTGVRRTPVCALLQQGIAAEWFATTADVYVRLGMIPENPEDRSTADGRASTVRACHARLARMIGGDPEITSLEETHRLASEAYARQRSMIVDGIRASAERHGPFQRVILAGSGEFLARAAWIDFAAESDFREHSGAELLSLTEIQGTDRSTAACAFAVAVLLEETQLL